jgi:hypothetical protein
MDTVISSVSGLSHLNGYQVYALVDGAVQGLFTVSGGAITLTTPGSQVVVGLPYGCDLSRCSSIRAERPLFREALKSALRLRCGLKTLQG